MTVSINRDEWLAALREAEEPDDPNTLTATQFGELFDMNRNSARRKLCELVKLGKAERTTKFVADSTGRKQRYPAYRLVRTPNTGRVVPKKGKR